MVSSAAAPLPVPATPITVMVSMGGVPMYVPSLRFHILKQFLIITFFFIQRIISGVPVMVERVLQLERRATAREIVAVIFSIPIGAWLIAKTIFTTRAGYAL